MNDSRLTQILDDVTLRISCSTKENPRPCSIPMSVVNTKAYLESDFNASLFSANSAARIIDKAIPVSINGINQAAVGT